jgi:hypothetical protein
MHSTVLLAWMGGGVFILGALQCVYKGAVALRSGHRVERSKDPVGFWGLVIFLFLAGVFVVGIGVAQAL